jgi:hypothetical protein
MLGKEQYMQVLDNCLFPKMKESFPEHDGIFMQFFMLHVILPKP